MADAAAHHSGDECVAIRDAACLIVVDRAHAEPRLLMGQRLATQVFLPNKWVFPGGRVDAGDVALADALSSHDPASLGTLQHFALAAVRELFEETGYIAGEYRAFSCLAPEAWGAFAATGHAPCPQRVTPVARAITPPGRVRRFDTWFFAIERSELAETTGSGDGELLNLDWFSLSQARCLDLPNITRLVLDDITEKLRLPQPSARPAIPFYFHDGCVFQRTLINY